VLPVNNPTDPRGLSTSQGAAIDAAQAFSRVLLRAAPIAAHRDAEERFRRNPEVEAMRQRLAAAVRAYRQAERAGTVTIAQVQEARQSQDALQTHPAVAAYGQAREAVLAFLRLVNDEISGVLGVDFGATAGVKTGCKC
jgi:cell fate (sporulation/competence/biofilm development) regulator YlbF (YheA/YmcA/DUF963 family)